MHLLDPNPFVVKAQKSYELLDTRVNMMECPEDSLTASHLRFDIQSSMAKNYAKFSCGTDSYSAEKTIRPGHG